jgi:hypothetical protein
VIGGATQAAAGRRPRRGLLAAGLVVFLAGLALACWGVYEATRIGTCASGGPFEIARPCPEGTGTKIAAIFGGTLIGLVGLALAFAGRAGARGRGPVRMGIVLWSLTFLAAAAAVALGAFGPDADPQNEGARVAAITILAVFVPMALVPLVGSVVLSRASRHERDADRRDAIPLTPLRGRADPPRPPEP